MFDRKIRALLAATALLIGAPAFAVLSDEQFIDLCVDGTVTQVRAALDAGAKVDARDGQGATALMFAISSRRRDVAALLLDRGADIDARDTAFGFTAFAHAAQSDPEPETLDFLLRRGAKINTRSKTGLTPLMGAANGGANPEVIALLLKAGAEINAADNDGFTPLIWAAFSATPEVVSTLLDAGADARARERLHGKTVLDYATANPKMQGLQGMLVLQRLRERAR
ncbi:hypothetical protein AGMMS50256_30200 [Betaproteobacteria bacterium]|nr:hypothetical protein AGMMS50256_30200 [Betaproteobacteria bacterium]